MMMTRVVRIPLLAVLLVACDEGSPSTPPPEVRFTETAAASGIDFMHHNGAQGDYYYPETYGSGAGFLDYDGDGRLDIYLVNGASLSGAAAAPVPTNRLYHNGGAGTFADVTGASGAGDPGFGMGCAAADYDNDGDQDLFVANFGANVLYQNSGDRFVDVTQAAGTGDARWSSSAGFLDHDMDGDLDLFVANYIVYSLETNPVCRKSRTRAYCDPDVFEPIGDVLYRNDGGRFVDVTTAAGVDLVGRGLGVAFQDYDRDGDTDIYVANDGTANFLYDNQGGHFVDVGLASGTRFNMNGKAEAGMGVDFGDYDGDRHPDIVVGNFAYETTTLYRSTGEGSFADATDELGIGAASHMRLTFGARFVDYDNDGRVDVLATNGHVLDNIERIDPGQSYAQPSQMLRNEAEQFTDVSASLGPDFTAPIVARGTAVADYDDDGDLDVLVNTVAGRPRLLRNDGGNAGHWLLVHLVGARQRDALGARVTVTAGERSQEKQRQSAGSYQATHDPRLHFGLGAATVADVEVRWPSGRVQHLTDVAANRLLRVEEAAASP